MAKKKLKKGLQVAGGTPLDVQRERREREKKRRKKLQKDKMIKKKMGQLKEEKKKEKDKNERVQDELDSDRNLPGVSSGEIQDNNLDSSNVNKLEEDIKRLEKEKEDIDKKTLWDRTKNTYRNMRKIGRMMRRVAVAGGAAMKMWPLTLSIILLLTGAFAFTGYTVSFVLPAGAFAVLTDEEDGDVSVEDDGVTIEEHVGVDITLENFTKGSVWPVPYTKTITSGFGPRIHPITKEVGRVHEGIDIAAAGVRGQDIVAFQAGKVVVSQYHVGLGNYVTIQHGDDVRTVYGHMRDPGIKNGTMVKAGDVIGKVGTTGSSTGDHLHFEVRIGQGDGKYKAVDPMPYVRHLID